MVSTGSDEKIIYASTGERNNVMAAFFGHSLKHECIMNDLYICRHVVLQPREIWVSRELPSLF